MPEYLSDDEVFGTADGNKKYLSDEDVFGPPENGNFVRGVKSATDSMQGSLYGAAGLAGDILGIDKVRDWGYEGFKRNEEEAAQNKVDVQKFTDINSSKSFGQWAAGGLGQLVPSVVEAGVTAGIGAGLGAAAGGGIASPITGAAGAATGLFGKTAVKGLLKNQIEKQIASKAGSEILKKSGREAAETAALRSIGRSAGAKAGIVAGVAPLEAGGMYGEDANKHGIENANPWSAGGLGLISGASELISPGGALISGIAGGTGKRFLAELGRTAGDKLWKRLGIEIPKAMGGEFAQEATQEFIGKVNEKINDTTGEVSLTDKQALVDYLNAGAVGALGGVAFGVVGARGQQPTSQEQPPPVIDATQQQPVTSPAPVVTPPPAQPVLGQPTGTVSKALNAAPADPLVQDMERAFQPKLGAPASVNPVTGEIQQGTGDFAEDFGRIDEDGAEGARQVTETAAGRAPSAPPQPSQNLDASSDGRAGTAVPDSGIGNGALTEGDNDTVRQVGNNISQTSTEKDIRGKEGGSGEIRTPSGRMAGEVAPQETTEDAGLEVSVKSSSLDVSTRDIPITEIKATHGRQIGNWIAAQRNAGNADVSIDDARKALGMPVDEKPVSAPQNEVNASIAQENTIVDGQSKPQTAVSATTGDVSNNIKEQSQEVKPETFAKPIANADKSAPPSNKESGNNAKQSNLLTPQNAESAELVGAVGRGGEQGVTKANNTEPKIDRNVSLDNNYNNLSVAVSDAKNDANKPLQGGTLFDPQAYDKEWKRKIAESKAKNLHADSLPYGVESMRGQRIKHAITGEVGVVTTVGSDNNVYVLWEEYPQNQGMVGDEALISRKELSEHILLDKPGVKLNRKTGKYLILKQNNTPSAEKNNDSASSRRRTEGVPSSPSQPTASTKGAASTEAPAKRPPKKSETAEEGAGVQSVAEGPRREYTKPSSVETPAQGVLNSAKEGKKAAWQKVQRLQEQIKNEPIGGTRAGLRLELIRAKDKHREYIKLEEEAKAAIESRANQLGKTTVKNSVSPTPPQSATISELTPSQLASVKNGEYDENINPLSLKEHNGQLDIALDLEEALDGNFTIIPWRMPDSLVRKDPKGRVNMGGVPKSDYEMSERLARIFGKEIVWISAVGEGTLNGLAVQRGPLSKYIFVDVRTPLPSQVVYGHELSHHLEVSHPQQYNDLFDALSPLIKNIDKYRDKLQLVGDDEFVKREIIGDLLGDNFNDPAFWTEVAAQSPSKFKQIAAKIKRWISSLLDKLTMRGYGSSQYVTDLVATRKALAKLMVQVSTEKQRNELIKNAGSYFSGKASTGINSFAQNAKMSLNAAKRRIENMDALKKWFKGSKVVDENGEPLVVYHGTRRKFSEFDESAEKSGPYDVKGFFFTDSREEAEFFTEEYDNDGYKRPGDEPTVLEVFLKMKRPLILAPAENSTNYYDSNEQKILRVVKEGRYDGVIVKGEDHVQYVVFKPTQIKSIFNQSWDGTNPRIMQSTGPSNLSRWLGASVVDKVVYHGSETFGRADNFIFDPDRPNSTSKTKSPGAGLGTFFTEDRAESMGYAGTDGEVFPMRLRIENPLEINSYDLPEFKNREEAVAFRRRKQLQGHDGIHLKDLDHWIIFEPGQAKSADRNNGEYSRKSYDVRYSIGDERNPPPIGKTQEEFLEEQRAKYRKNREMQRSFKGKAIRNSKAALGKVLAGADKYLGASSTRLKNIHPKIEAKFRALDFNTGTRLARDIRAVQPLLEKAKKMSRDDFADWDFARKNSDTEMINSLIKKYGMEKEYERYRETLNRLRDEANHVGLDIGWIKEYAPRVIKDAQGFLNAVGKGDMRPIITDAIRKRAQHLGISVADMSPEMKADVVSNMLFGGWSGVGKPGNAKERTIKEIPHELNQYYMDSDAALMHYLHSIRKHVEIRNFFGKIPTVIAQAKSAMHQAQARLRKAVEAEETAYMAIHPGHKKGEPFPESDRITGIKETVAQYRSILDRYKNERNYSDNIAEYVIELQNDMLITPEDEKTLVDVMKARFHEQGTRGIIQAYKNLSYIDTMGNPFSAITQIGDLAWTIYANGWYSTAKAAMKSIGKSSRITKEDVGIERIAQEFADTDTLSNAVAKVFKWVGLEKMDSIGKEAFLNAALEKFEKQATKNPEKLKGEIENIFESDTDSVIADLQNKRITDNVKLLVYSNLLDFQPAALSEMSEQYLKAGNGRVFYMLKSYSLKQFDVFRREAYNNLKSGNKEQVLKGAKNLVYLAALLVMANAGADELKDWLLGRESTFEDRVVDNVLKLFGVSKYVTWKARTEGVGTAAAKQMLPPFKFVDSLYKDVATAGDEKGLEIVGSVPVVGKLAYWHIGRGSHNKKDITEKRFADKRRKLSAIKDKVERHPELRAKHGSDLAELRRLNRVQYRANQMKARENKIAAMVERSLFGKPEVLARAEAQRLRLLEGYLANSSN